MAVSSLFDLTPTEEQQITIDMLQRFSAEEIAKYARTADESGELPDGFLYKTCTLGLNYLPISEELGGIGAGRSPISNALNIETLARGDMAMAMATIAPLSVINCVVDSGSMAQQEIVAGKLLDEKFVAAALATLEPGIVCDPEDLHTTATKQADGSYLLSGQKSMVAFGESLELMVVLAKEIDQQGSSLGTQAFLLTDTNELSFEAESYMGLRPLPLFKMTINQKALDENAKLENFDLREFINKSRIAASALAVGTCQSVLDYVVPYVNERVAFGEPISHRQAVAFTVADMATELEGLRMMLYRAASQCENNRDCNRMCYLTFRQAVKYGMKIGSDGVQMLGGHGFTREHPVELWYRNLRGLATLEGVLQV